MSVKRHAAFGERHTISEHIKFGLKSLLLLRLCDKNPCKFVGLCNNKCVTVLVRRVTEALLWTSGWTLDSTFGSWQGSRSTLPNRADHSPVPLSTPACPPTTTGSKPKWKVLATNMKNGGNDPLYAFFSCRNIVFQFRRTNMSNKPESTQINVTYEI